MCLCWYVNWLVCVYKVLLTGLHISVHIFLCLSLVIYARRNTPPYLIFAQSFLYHHDIIQYLHLLLMCKPGMN